ncbi:hypothetical protein HZH68_007794 [Vespula germanica]|uniref:Uncharacterized protein n=1 Tax=Vespula germanica TaxID=30212 RepID=A0A834K317_VESGE|nr:hypothetical protein HZH68_007794 [Vespula germanica]
MAGKGRNIVEMAFDASKLWVMIWMHLIESFVIRELCFVLSTFVNQLFLEAMTSVLVKTQNKSSKRILKNIDGVPMPDRLEDGIGRITMTSAKEKLRGAFMEYGSGESSRSTFVCGVAVGRSSLRKLTLEDHHPTGGLVESSSPGEWTSRDRHHPESGHRGTIITRRVDIEGPSSPGGWTSRDRHHSEGGHRGTVIIRRVDIEGPSFPESGHRGTVITRRVDIERLSLYGKQTSRDHHHMNNGHRGTIITWIMDIEEPSSHG